MASSSAAPQRTEGSPRWVAILAITWLAGLGIMLLRTAGSVIKASRLVHGPRVNDPAILMMVGRIREELGIGRLIRVIEVGAEHGPAALGAFWPTLLIPASAMTGLPLDSLHAIIIHELAHIRRYDYLINIAQMVVESVLFFNPAVWWIGRQVRLEREACCDATAVRLTGRPLDYSRAGRMGRAVASHRGRRGLDRRSAAMDIAGTRSPRAAAGGSAGDAGVALRAPPAADRRPGLARATLGRYPRRSRTGRPDPLPGRADRTAQGCAGRVRPADRGRRWQRNTQGDDPDSRRQAAHKADPVFTPDENASRRQHGSFKHNPRW